MFKNASLGTKISSAIALLVIVCLGAMALILIKIARGVQEKESYKLLDNVSSRMAEATSVYMREILISGQMLHDNVQEYISRSEDNERDLIIQTNLALEIGQYSAYAYVYVQNAATVGARLDPNNLLPSGEFLYLARQTVQGGQNKAVPMKAHERILELPSFKKAMQEGKTVMGQPITVDLGNGDELGFFIVYPIYDRNKKLAGASALFMDMRGLSQLVLDNKYSVFEGDYRFLLSQEGIFVAHPDSITLGRHFSDLNTHPTVKTIENAVKSHQDGVYEYVNYRGELSYTALAHLDISTFGYVAIGVIAPQRSIFASVDTIRNIIIACVVGCVAIMIIFVFFYIKTQVVSRVHNISHQLFSFFDYLNYKTNTPPKLLPPKAKDELGQMAEAINENIKNTQNGLIQDKKAVDESVESVKRVEDGDLTTRIAASPRNPQLIQLKDSLNKLLDTLQRRVGSNMNEIMKVFNSYKGLDFTTKIQDAKGSVETTTNTLGDEIVTMLKTSA
ncbi:cache domain-containing protein, partial [Campylobacter troglodytis]|uniref:cache domain-containing protein n=1 Tax=Campylobacter troglodytis TaxID=654363 RepID=UPI0011595263